MTQLPAGQLDGDIFFAFKDLPKWQNGSKSCCWHDLQIFVRFFAVLMFLVAGSTLLMPSWRLGPQGGGRPGGARQLPFFRPNQPLTRTPREGFRVGRRPLDPRSPQAQATPGTRTAVRRRGQRPVGWEGRWGPGGDRPGRRASNGRGRRQSKPTFTWCPGRDAGVPLNVPGVGEDRRLRGGP